MPACRTRRLDTGLRRKVNRRHAGMGRNRMASSLGPACLSKEVTLNKKK